MKTKALLVLVVASVVIVGCSKSDTPKTAPSASVTAAASTPPLPSGSASGEAAGGGGTAAAAKALSGTYSLAPATLHIAEGKDYANVKQAKDDPSKLVGEGQMTLNIEGSKVTGSVDTGPASPALIDGTLMDGEIRGNVRRKDPKDDGLTGTLLAKLVGDGADGKLSLAEGNAAILREGKMTLKKK
jgi:hypothetical protein